MSDQYVSREDFAQVTLTIDAIQEITTRVDERVKILLEKQLTSDSHMHDIRNILNAVVNRVNLVEIRLESKNDAEVKKLVETNREKVYEIEKQVQTLMMKESGHEKRWNKVFDFVGKIIWIITTAYILYKLGFNPPPIS